MASLEVLDRYDPGVAKAEIVSETREGPGSARRCDLTPGGWFKERISEWKPHEALAFELYACTLPVRRLKHSYRLLPDGGGTVVQQRMEYQLKFWPLGRLLDAVVVKRSGGRTQCRQGGVD